MSVTQKLAEKFSKEICDCIKKYEDMRFSPEIILAMTTQILAFYSNVNKIPDHTVMEFLKSFQIMNQEMTNNEANSN